ncbi:MAG: ROK family protein [Bryobacteraceae bacterium]|nr:ROK family protein [Bryobacteraceae bacterium]
MEKKKLTLCVDIGGSRTKAIVVDPQGKPVTERVRLDTPRPALPDAIIEVIEQLAGQSGKYDRVSVGFPGVIHDGVVKTAPNLDPAWAGFDLDRALEAALKKPVRAANDAAVQGLGAISGKGLEMVITLGTGVGCAIYTGGRLAVPLEMAHHPFRKGRTYEDCLGHAALLNGGKKKWNKRLQEAIGCWERLVNYDRLFLGGGNTEFITFELPANVTVSSNQEGMYGGLGLWTERSV